MPWNWELPEWPTFQYDPKSITQLEKQFLLGVGSSFAYLNTIDEQDYRGFLIDVLSTEGMESARIEGELLDRESLQSSIKYHFGLQPSLKRGADREAGMAEVLCSVYRTFENPLTHDMLWQWHQMLFEGSSHLTAHGKYRTHEEPMQIVSNRTHSPIVFFEAPPSNRVFQEMERFIQWFNAQNDSHSILCKAAIVHVYFESIHPFEDGNGRIGRVLVEKILSQGVKRPLLIAISKMLEKRKKEYYAALERCNRTVNVQQWVDFFVQIIWQAHEESLSLLSFLIEKSKLLNTLSGRLNARQEKVLLRMFAEGPNGFKGGLSAENYIAITRTTRATATRDLADLVEKGALVKSGELRHTRYRLRI